MRIGIEAQRLFRKKKHGMDIFALQLIRSLQHLDRDNEYFIFVKPGPEGGCLKETENFHIIEVQGWTYLDWEQWALPRALKDLELDLLHCTSNTAPIMLEIPLVVTIHDVIYLSTKDAQKGTLYQRLGHYYRKYVVPVVASKARQIITVSNYELEVMKEYFDAWKLKFIYNGVPDHFFNRQEGCERMDLPREYLLFLGNMAHKKNMRNVLRAYAWYVDKTVEPKPLVIAETSEKELRGILSELNLHHIRPAIHLTGYVPQKELPELYRRASLFLYPSLRESFGIPILEAMASGTPVITSDYASMPEVAGGCALTVESKDHKRLGRAMAYLLGDEELQQTLREKGVKHASGFTWRKAALQYLSLYEQHCLSTRLQVSA